MNVFQLKISFLIIIFCFLINNDIFSKNIVNYIYKDLNDKKKLENIIKFKKLVYTVILGSYDKPKPFIKQEGYDYYLFTDDNSIEKYIKANWTVLKIPNEVKNLKVNTVKKQRFLKLHPHLFFKSYDLSIYIDGTFIIKGNLTEFLLIVYFPSSNKLILTLFQYLIILSFFETFFCDC